MSFSQLPAVKKDTENGAPGKFFGPSYFVTALPTMSDDFYPIMTYLTLFTCSKIGRQNGRFPKFNL